MKKLLPLLIILLSIPTTKAQSICFTENKGQVYDQNYRARPDVLFGVMAGNMAVHIKNTGVSYQLYRVDKWKDATEAPFSLGQGRGVEAKFPNKEIEQQTIYRIDLTWVNANPNFTKTTDEALPGYNNYYLASCPNGALNVKSYKGITLHNLYNGINLHYYEKQGQLKHDYIVAPHANYKNIQLKVEGAQVSINKDGSLLLNTPLGKVQEGAPIVYQQGKQLKAKWVITGTEPSRSVSFTIDNYNPNYELIIDPVTRLWGTYYGDAESDFSSSCAADASGNVYMSGSTLLSTGTIIATSASYQSNWGGSFDAFLVKFDANGVRQWGTYYGDVGEDYGNYCSTDAFGNVYMSGTTGSNIAITTSGSHQSTSGGGISDAFLVKFDANGVRQWGTYYGGSGYDYGWSCSTDASGNVYMSGETSSSSGTIIATSVSHQSVSTGGGMGDAFLVKFDSNGARQWGTYYGGIGNDAGFSCITDVSGNVYMAGHTDSSTGIATSGSHQSSFGGGSFDAFLVKFDANGVRQWGTYYVGVGFDRAFSCSADTSGNVYMSGLTNSSTGIATSGSHQSSFGGGSFDAFLVKFDANGVRQWGTYYGGLGDDRGYSCCTDVSGNVYISGYTESATGTVIATSGSHQSNFGGTSANAFLAKFDANGMRQWGTYYGGLGHNFASSCIIDALGNIFMSGFTSCSTGTVIASSGSHQSIFGGGSPSSDAFLVKLTDCTALFPTAAVSNTLCSGATLNFTASITSSATPTYAWTGPNSFTSSIQNPVITGANAQNIGTYTLTVNNSGCVEITTTEVTAIYTTPTINVNSGAICIGDTFTIIPTGASTYTIQGGNNVVNPISNSSYTVLGISTQGCLSNMATSTVNVNKLPIMVSGTSNSIICGPLFQDSATLTASGATSYTWSNGSNASSIVVSPSLTTTYSITGTDANGCSNTAFITQSVSACTSLSKITATSNLLIIYPNPANDLLNIITSVNPDELVSIQIINNLGQVLYQSEIHGNESNIPVNQLANGIYYVQLINTSHQTITQKFIIQR